MMSVSLDVTAGMRLYMMWAALGFLIVVSIVLLKSWPVINVVETGRTPEYPDVQPRQYAVGRAQVFDAAMHAVNRLPRWALVSSRAETGEIRAEATTLVLRFVDDVVIRVTEQGNGTVVSVRSSSRVGRGDFGQNARNIRAFLAACDRQLERRATHS